MLWVQPIMFLHALDSAWLVTFCTWCHILSWLQDAIQVQGQWSISIELIPWKLLLGYAYHWRRNQNFMCRLECRVNLSKFGATTEPLGAHSQVADQVISQTIVPLLPTALIRPRVPCIKAGTGFNLGLGIGFLLYFNDEKRNTWHLWTSNVPICMEHVIGGCPWHENNNRLGCRQGRENRFPTVP